MSSPTPQKNDSSWTSPPVLLAILGMILGIGGSYAAFDSRITALEVRGERLAVIEAKLDRLIDVEKVR